MRDYELVQVDDYSEVRVDGHIVGCIYDTMNGSCYVSISVESDPKSSNHYVSSVMNDYLEHSVSYY